MERFLNKDLEMSGTVNKSYKSWIGKWYKPWTWFGKKYCILVIDKFEFTGVSMINNSLNVHDD